MEERSTCCCYSLIQYPVPRTALSLIPEIVSHHQDWINTNRDVQEEVKREVLIQFIETINYGEIIGVDELSTRKIAKSFESNRTNSMTKREVETRNLFRAWEYLASFYYNEGSSGLLTLDLITRTHELLMDYS